MIALNKSFLEIVMACLILFGMAAVSCEAGSLDKYHDIFASRSYTFKFRTVSNSSLRLITNDASSANQFGGGGFDPDADNRVTREMKKEYQKLAKEKAADLCDVIVMDGDNRYTEISGKCKLIKDGEVFTYMHNFLDGSYFGGRMSKRGYFHKDEISPGVNNWMTYDNRKGYGKKITSKDDIEDVGSPMLMKLLAVIYPISNANVELPEYSFVTYGQSDDGSVYEDYSGEDISKKHVVRCYFKNDELVKMAYASYPHHTDNPSDDIEKYVIEIKELSNLPDKQYFALPSGLKVVRE